MLTQDYPRGTAASGPAPQKEDDSLKKASVTLNTLVTESLQSCIYRARRIRNDISVLLDSKNAYLNEGHVEGDDSDNKQCGEPSPSYYSYIDTAKILSESIDQLNIILSEIERTI